MDKNGSMPVGLKPETHMPQLDGLRAIAALIIVYVHWIHHADLFGTPWGDIGKQLVPPIPSSTHRIPKGNP
jgi:hypothetical protein